MILLLNADGVALWVVQLGLLFEFLGLVFTRNDSTTQETRRHEHGVISCFSIQHKHDIFKCDTRQLIRLFFFLGPIGDKITLSSNIRNVIFLLFRHDKTRITRYLVQFRDRILT